MAKARTELIHCDNCGEDYAATYRRCPFCNAKAGQRYDDDGADYGYDDAPRRRGGKRLADDRRSDGTAARIAIYVLLALLILGAILFVVSVLLPNLLVPGPAVVPTAAPAPSAEQPALPEPSVAPVPDEGDSRPGYSQALPTLDGMPASDDPLSLDSPDLPAVDPVPTATVQPSAAPTPAPATPAPTPAPTPAGPRLSSSDFSITAAYPDPIRLRVIGGEAASWTSSKESVATVSDNGTVTAVGNGHAKITCTLTDGAALTCDVHVSGVGAAPAASASPSAAPASAAPSAPSAGGARLNHTDFSITAAFPDPIRLRVIGGEAASWKSSREGVATVSGNGTVTAVGNGSAKITCTLTDGAVLTCDVHVSGK